MYIVVIHGKTIIHVHSHKSYNYCTIIRIIPLQTNTFKVIERLVCEFSFYDVLTRAPLGVLDFHALLGGVFEHPPPLLTRLLGHVAIRDRRRSKERQQ